MMAFGKVLASEAALLGVTVERHLATHDDVVQNADSWRVADLAQALHSVVALGARGSVSVRVVMANEHRCGVLGNGAAKSDGRANQARGASANEMEYLPRGFTEWYLRKIAPRETG